MKIKAVIILLFTTLFSGHAFSQKNNAVAASVDKNRLLIGEPIELTLEATFPPAAGRQFFRIDSFPHFEILKTYPLDSQQSGKSVRLSQRLTITSWDSGRWVIPSFALPNTRYRTRPIMVSVGYASFDRQKDYNEIKDIREVGRPGQQRWFWYLILASLLGVLFYLLFPYRKKAPATEKERQDAYRIAVSELQKLKKEAVPADAKLFYVRLVDVLRRYLQQKKGISSFSRTSDDLILQIKGLKLPDALHNRLAQALRLSDAVKFARYQPEEAENREALEAIQKSIDAIENA